MHVDDKELFAALVLAIISRRDPMRKFKGIYFYINNSRVEKTQDYGNDLDNERYDLGNYFLFSDEAKQVLESKESKIFGLKREEERLEMIKVIKNNELDKNIKYKFYANRCSCCNKTTSINVLEIKVGDSSTVIMVSICDKCLFELKEQIKKLVRDDKNVEM